MNSTYDSTSTGGEGSLNEFSADVKTPGNGKTYTFGTIDVFRTGGTPTPQFSNANAVPATGVNWFDYSGDTARQITILQIRNADQSIYQQRYLYGSSSGDDHRATNARGISVWPADDDDDVRIAVCGETYDEIFPSSQAPNGYAGANANHPSGFIAVFNGNGDLLWTHHFFGTHAGADDGDCAITDVSIRVQTIGGTATDVVTYCGISSNGVPNASNGSLSPVNAFAAPTGGASGFTPASGSTNNGYNQWDGIVGRLTRDHANTQSTTTVFHAVVGGSEQDGLFGISESDTNRFAVAGSTTRITSSGTSPYAYPFTNTATTGIVWNTESAYCVGSAMVFDASGSPLVLENAQEIGITGSSYHTIARDVFVQRDFRVSDEISGNALFFVGSTDGGNLQMSTWNSFHTGTGTTTDGFLVFAVDTVAPTPISFDFVWGVYHGGTGNDGLTGVNGWNEFTDHVSVVGFSDEGGNSFDLDVGTYYVYTDPDSNHTTGHGALIRRGGVGGSNTDLPAAMGSTNAIVAGVNWVLHGLRDPAGGGIGVDQFARVSVVGTSDSSDYPTPFGQPYDSANDAVRTVFDMLPPYVGRTDATGDQSVLPPLYSSYPLTDGTTPTCGLLPFGSLIGETPPALARMLIDYEGDAPQNGVTNGALLLIRPPSNWSAVYTGLQLSFPANTPYTFTEGCQVWLLDPNQVVFTSVPVANSTPGMFRFPLSFTFPSSMEFGAQFVSLLNSPVPGGTPCNSTSSYLVSSPAIWIKY